MPSTSASASEPGLTLHFAHANGFPAASYHTLFNALPAHWQVLAIPKLGHAPGYPVNANWRNQVAELIQYVERNHEGDKGVIAIGHSMGAVVSFMAACQRPDLFDGLIMLDPPLITGVSSTLFRMAKLTPWINTMTPAHKAVTRRRQWPGSTDLVEYFASKSLFRHMDKRCIHDYVKSVTALDADNNWRLTFEPDVEAALFRNVPHNMGSFAGKLKCRAALVTGKQTTVCTPSMYGPFLRSNTIEHVQTEGGHMFPLEHPDAVAGLIQQIITDWQRN